MYVIYGLIPNDLPSLRMPHHDSMGGKASAHGLHAGNQLIRFADHPHVMDYLKESEEVGAHGFGTCITLDIPKNDIENVVKKALDLGLAADIVVDPTYPWWVDSETAHFLKDDCTVIWETEKNGKVLVTRKETTFGWLLVEKDTLTAQSLVGDLSLAK